MLNEEDIDEPDENDIVQSNTIIEIEIDNPTAQVDGEDVELDQSATILNDRMVVPARFIAKTLGVTVNWNENTQIVTIVRR